MGVYVSPDWLTLLNKPTVWPWAAVSATPTTIAGYGITDSPAVHTFYSASCAVSTVFALTHGLGAVANFKAVTYGMECTAAEWGYSVGDRVCTQCVDGARIYGFNIDGTAARFLTNTAAIGIYQKATAGSALNVITPTSWRFFVSITL